MAGLREHGSVSTPTPATGRATRRAAGHAPLVPPQHGAWAFLGLPVVVGWAVAPWTPLLVPLAVAWIAAYPASYFVLAVVAEGSRRHPQPGRFVRPLVVWAVPALACGVATAWFRPWLVWVGLAYLAAFAVNLAYARRRADRALANDVVLVVECAAMVPVTWAVGAGDRGWVAPLPVPTTVWVLTVAVALLLAGSTVQVKSLIRERADPRYARSSRGLAATSVLLAVGLAVCWGLPAGWWLVLPFAYFAVRAFAVRADAGRRAPRPGLIGVVELGGFLLLALVAVLLA